MRRVRGQAHDAPTRRIAHVKVLEAGDIAGECAAGGNVETIGRRPTRAAPVRCECAGRNPCRCVGCRGRRRDGHDGDRVKRPSFIAAIVYCVDSECATVRNSNCPGVGVACGMLWLRWADGPICFARLNTTDDVNARLVGGANCYIKIAWATVGGDLKSGQVNHR